MQGNSDKQCSPLHPAQRFPVLLASMCDDCHTRSSPPRRTLSRSQERGMEDSVPELSVVELFVVIARALVDTRRIKQNDRG